MSNIQTGAERMPHDLSHLGFLAGQIGRLITISTTPVIAGDSFEMDAVGALRLSPLRRGLAIDSTVDIFTFYVPHRHVYGEQWIKFMKDGVNATPLPTVNTTGYIDHAAFLGTINPDTNKIPKHLFQGYLNIYNNYFKAPWMPDRTEANPNELNQDDARYGFRCCHLKNIWTAPLPPETELSRQMTTSTTSIDIMGLQAAYANLHTDQERDYFMQRYHDVISSFGGKTSVDAVNRPLLVMRSNLWAFCFSSRRRHTRCSRDWSSDVCSSDLHVRGALHVVLPAHRHHGRTPATDHPAGEHQVQERGDQVGAVGVLGEAHRPQGAGVRPARVDLGRLADAVGRYARDLRRHLGRHRLHRRAHLVERVGPLREELLGLEPAGDHVVEHRVEQRHVGAGLHLEVDVGPRGQLGLARVGHDEGRAPLVGALDRRPEDGVGLRRVRPRDEDDVRRVLDLAHRARRRGRVQRPLHRRHRGGVAQARAVVDVVGAERSAEHPHDEVVLLVRAFGRGKARERVAAALALDAHQLLHRELHRLVPGSLAERLVPGRRRGHAVAQVQLQPREQRQIAPGFADRARRPRRLRVLTLSLDGLPRTAAALRARRSAPYPAAGLFEPTPTDEGLCQTVVMFGEIVAEATLHARRALVGGVELDVGRGDAYDLVARDVQVHLTPDAAVGAHRPDRALRPADLLRREPLPRHHLENGAGGAHTDALTAPGAARLVGIAVRAHDDFGVLAPLRHVQHADHLHVLARADAARAEDTGAHIVPDHRVARALVAVTQRQVAPPERAGRDAVAHHVALELVAGRGPAAVPQVVSGIALQQQPQHSLAVLDRGMGFGLHDHAVRHLGRAGRQQLRLALDRHEADPAVADDGQLGIPAQRGDVDDPRVAGRVEDRVLGVSRDPAAVDRERGHQA